MQINGEMHDLWRGMYQEGWLLEFFASKTRDKAAEVTTELPSMIMASTSKP